MILDFFTREGLYLLDTVPVRNQTYGFNQWDDVWNSPYINGNWNNNDWNGGYGNQGYYGNVMDSSSFSRLLRILQRTSGDNGKMRVIADNGDAYSFTSSQISMLMRTMMMEGSKLQVAKIMYRNCADRQNYQAVMNSLMLTSSKRELQQYISRM